MKVEGRDNADTPQLGWIGAPGRSSLEGVCMGLLQCEAAFVTCAGSAPICGLIYVREGRDRGFFHGFGVFALLSEQLACRKAPRGYGRGLMCLGCHPGWGPPGPSGRWLGVSSAGLAEGPPCSSPRYCCPPHPCCCSPVLLLGSSKSTACSCSQGGRAPSHTRISVPLQPLELRF